MEISATAKVYRAPWGWQVKLTTTLAGAVVLAVPGIFLARPNQPPLPITSLFLCLPIFILLGTALFSVRGYAISEGKLLIQRLCWTTCYPLAGLKTATFEPLALSFSLRLFGNSGLFAITGYFRNSKLGIFRAYVTDPQRCVVLDFTRRVVVVSPDRPKEFIQEAQAEFARSLGRGPLAGR